MVTEVPLSRGMVALVDDEDAATVLAAAPWSAWVDEHHTYACRATIGSRGQRTTIKLHTFLTGWSLVDHVNGDGLDNRRANLRPATHAQNMRNARRRSDNTSGYKGVTWERRRGRWCASIHHDRHRKHLGYFPTAHLAACAYDVAALSLHGEYARLNFPVVTS